MQAYFLLHHVKVRMTNTTCTVLNQYLTLSPMHPPAPIAHAGPRARACNGAPTAAGAGIRNVSMPILKFFGAASVGITAPPSIPRTLYPWHNPARPPPGRPTSENNSFHGADAPPRDR